MTFVMLWLNEHRMGLVLVLAFILWASTFGWYFRNMIRFWFVRGTPHSWSVDMVTRKAVARGKEQI